MESLSSKNENVKYSLCVINTFMEVVNESNHKPDKLWVDQGREF